MAEEVSSVPALENARCEAFVRALIENKSQRKAYREAFPASRKWKDSTVDSKASVLFSNDKVLARYTELQTQAAQGAVLTRQRKREILCTIAEDEELEPKDRIRAIDTDNKMEGEYTEKVEASETNNNLFAQIKESINGLQAIQPEAAADAAVVETSGTESVRRSHL